MQRWLNGIGARLRIWFMRVRILLAALEIDMATTFEHLVATLEYQFVLALWRNDPQLWTMLDRYSRTRKPVA